ncbi:MAG: DegV family protein [Candidatus Nanopelagicales bacterium]|jgi:DegV family protein with EDD domain|nr:DegV family protein [Actinomycetes bacterium]MCH9830611.1 DegV family protein [Actinomycetes bacterium]
MSRVAVVTDNSAGVPLDLAVELGIEVVPVDVIVGGETLPLGESMDIAQLMLEGKKVTTSRPTPEAFDQVFQALAVRGYDQILVTTLSAKLSGTFDSAVIASKDSSIPVNVLDSGSVGLGLGFPVLNAARAAKSGAELAEVLEVLESGIKSSQVFFYVNTLEYLKRGGRVSPTSALLGTALAVKPIMTILDGEIVLKEKVRTQARALTELVHLAVEHAKSLDSAHVGLQYFGDRTLVDQCALMVAEQFPSVGLLITEVSPVVGVHAGPGLVGISVVQGT